MMTNDEWRVELAGSIKDLQYLSQHSRPPTWKVIEEEDRFSLIGTYLRECKNSVEVRQKATELLDSIDGAAKLQMGALYDGVSLGEWVHDGTKWTKRVGTSMVFRWRVESLDGQPEVDYFKWSIAMLDDEHVAEALRYFRNQEYWAYSHNKIVEIIMMDMDPRNKRSTDRGKKRIIELGWVTPDAIKNFIGTINNRSLIGEDARHATYRGQTVTLKEREKNAKQAKAFIAKLLKTWLRWKYEQQKLTRGRDELLQ